MQQCAALKLEVDVQAIGYRIDNAVRFHASNLEISFFESVLFQQAMLNGLVWFGPRLCFLPWHCYAVAHRFPALVGLLNTITLSCLSIINGLYGCVAGSGLHEKKQAWFAEQQQVVENIISNFCKGRAVASDPIGAKLCMVAKRNQQFVQEIIQNAANNTTMYVVGAVHLPGELGMLALLKQQGYELKPIKLLVDEVVEDAAIIA